MKKIVIYISVLLMIILSSCSKDDLFDLFVGPPPKFIDEEQFDKKLNIFGVLRPDTSFINPLLSPLPDTIYFPMSYIHVSRTLMAVNDTISDSIPVPDVNVEIYKIENSIIIDTVIFNFTSFDGQFVNTRYRPDGFYPKPGEIYRLMCFKEGYDTVFAQTVIPNKPQILGNVKSTKKSLSFVLKNDPLIYLYEIFVLSNEDYYYERKQPVDVSNLKVNIDLDFELAPSTIILIYGYDEGLAGYFSFPNIFIKPNTYRPPFTTVEGGYGGFGSLNYTSIIIE